jgi:hypothetical protein
LGEGIVTPRQLGGDIQSWTRKILRERRPDLPLVKERFRIPLPETQGRESPGETDGSQSFRRVNGGAREIPKDGIDRVLRLNRAAHVIGLVNTEYTTFNDMPRGKTEAILLSEQMKELSLGLKGN